MIEQLTQSADYIFAKTQIKPTLGIILGSGLGDFADSLENKTVIKYSDIPNFPKGNVLGHAHELVIGNIGNVNIVAMKGRFHFYEENDMEKVVFPVRVLKLLGVEKIVVTNAAGGIDTSYKVGDLVVIKDHINLLGTNPLLGKNINDLGPRFPDMTNGYDKELRSKLKEVFEKLHYSYKEGVYCACTGPSYETPAEIRMLKVIGGSMVGMSTVPEVIVANHTGIKILGISCITNMAAGILDQPLNHDEVIEAGKMVKEKFKKVLKEFISSL